MSGITTHILDTTKGRPAADVPITLSRLDGTWKELGRGTTDADGRLRTWLPDAPLAPGTYRITFDTGSYFRAQKIESFYPSVSVDFIVTDPNSHFHVPLLL